MKNPMSRREFGKFVGAAAAGLAGGAVLLSGCAGSETTPEKHACKGMNSCKGQGGCSTGDNTVQITASNSAVGNGSVGFSFRLWTR